MPLHTCHLQCQRGEFSARSDRILCNRCCGSSNCRLPSSGLSRRRGALKLSLPGPPQHCDVVPLLPPTFQKGIHQGGLAQTTGGECPTPSGWSNTVTQIPLLNRAGWRWTVSGGSSHSFLTREFPGLQTTYFLIHKLKRTKVSPQPLNVLPCAKL